jgi:triosephosphate isomerase
VASLEKLIAEFNAAGPIPANVEVVIGCPFIHIPIALMQLRDDVEIAAQDCSLTGCGAYTGEIAASQLKDLGVTWVILGHSERREGFGMVGEDSELVAKKTKKALEEGLKVMLCIGEKKEEREAGTTMEVCASQLKPVADILSKEDWANVSSECISF